MVESPAKRLRDAAITGAIMGSGPPKVRDPSEVIDNEVTIQLSTTNVNHQAPETTPDTPKQIELVKSNLRKELDDDFKRRQEITEKARCSSVPMCTTNLGESSDKLQSSQHVPVDATKDQHVPADANTTNNRTECETQSSQTSNDLSHIFTALGSLTDQLKEVITNTQNIPLMLQSITTLQTKMADVSGRVLCNEENLTKLDHRTTSLSSKLNPLVKQMEENNNNILRNEEAILKLQQQLSSNIQAEKEREIVFDESMITNCIENSLSAGISEVERNLAEKIDNRLETVTSRLTTVENTTTVHSSTSTTVYADLRAEMKEMRSNFMKLDESISRRIKDLESLPPPTKPTPTQQPPKPPPKTVLDHDVVIIGDSNTTPIDMRMIGKGVARKRFTQYTIPQIRSFYKNIDIKKQPKKIVLHVGTNDIAAQGEPVEVIADMRNLIEETQTIFTDARIFISSIFNRKDKTDPLNESINNINTVLAGICDATPGLTLIDNSNIHHRHMFDEKHLDENGHHIFVWNIRHNVFGEVPTCEEDDDEL
jgi:hypothetical protein